MGPFDPFDLVLELPMTLTLCVGLVICYRNRYRHPRRSKLLGLAMLAELLWKCVGWRAYFYLKYLFLKDWAIINRSDAQDTSWMAPIILSSLPASFIEAVIWSVALWAVLMVNDCPAAANGDSSLSHKAAASKD